MSACHTCHGTKDLKPETETWTMFDGTFCKQEIFRCVNCRNLLEELDNFKVRDSWVGNALDKLIKNETARAAIKLVPLWVYIGGWF